MTTYKELKKLYMTKQITEHEYHAMKEAYIRRMIHMYMRDLITKEQFDEYTKE